MKILIDGYNLIFAWGWMPANQSPQATEAARIKLYQKLAQLIPTYMRGQVLIVFDYKSPAGSRKVRSLESEAQQAGFQVRFAHDYPDADTLIEELIRREIAPKRLVVVSTDQRLRTAAQRRKARSIRSEEFLDEIKGLVAECVPSDNKQENLPVPPAIFDSESDSGYMGGKQEAVASLGRVDWLAEFGFDSVEIEVEPTSNPNADRDSSEINLDDLVDVRFKTD
jgi:hypothetical protein